jgi:hypothetical protein
MAPYVFTIPNKESAVKQTILAVNNAAPFKGRCTAAKNPEVR